jgi:hypothetical protein
MKLLSLLFGAKSMPDREDAPTNGPEIMESHHGISGDPFEETDSWVWYHCQRCGGWVSGCQHGWHSEED